MIVRKIRSIIDELKSYLGVRYYVIARQRTHKLRKIFGMKGLLRTLASSPLNSDGCLAASRLNKLSEINDSRTYLEIGVAQGGTLEAIEVEHRIGVDPTPNFDTEHLPERLAFYRTTSDVFFSSLDPDTKFDLIFLDGLHEFKQTYRDLVNAFEHLSKNGVCLIDDTVPFDAIAALPSHKDSIRESRKSGLGSPRPWMGDVYKVIYMIHTFHPELDYATYVETGQHHQTLVWRKNRASQVNMDIQHSIDSTTTLTYESIFKNGIPEWFNPMSQSEINNSIMKSLIN